MFIDHTPIMADWGWATGIYCLTGWRYMAGTFAWMFARDGMYDRDRARPDGSQKLGALLLGFLTFPVAPVVWAVKHSDSNNKTSSLLFPDPEREKVNWRERRTLKLQQKLKERDARIKELEKEAGI